MKTRCSPPRSTLANPARRGVWRVTRRGIRIFVVSALWKPEHDSTPHWSKARVAPFCEGSRIFMQDVGSKEDTELSRNELQPQLPRVACRIPWTLSVYWKWTALAVSEFCQRFSGKNTLCA